jgi:hypothetical protein
MQLVPHSLLHGQQTKDFGKISLLPHKHLNNILEMAVAAFFYPRNISYSRPFSLRSFINK